MKTMALKNFLIVLFTLPLFASDSLIYGPPYAEIIKELIALEREFPDSALTINYGTSAGNQPLYLIKIQRRAKFRINAPAVVITGATHGYEYLNIEDRLPRWILENQNSTAEIDHFLNLGGTLYIVPIFNPDGYEGIVNETAGTSIDSAASTLAGQNRNRWNANQKDLNRDYDLIPLGEKKFTQPETLAFVEFLDTDLRKDQLKLRFALDYHCCGRHENKDVAQLGYPWAFKLAPIPESDLLKHQQMAVGIKNRFLNENIVSGPWSEMLYEAPGTSTDYFYAKYGALAFTFEGLEVLEPQRFHHHKEMWRFILEKVSKESDS